MSIERKIWKSFFFSVASKREISSVVTLKAVGAKKLRQKTFMRVEICKFNERLLMTSRLSPFSKAQREDPQLERKFRKLCGLNKQEIELEVELAKHQISN
jgi:hypothetical protein